MTFQRKEHFSKASFPDSRIIAMIYNNNVQPFPLVNIFLGIFTGHFPEKQYFQIMLRHSEFQTLLSHYRYQISLKLFFIPFTKEIISLEIPNHFGIDKLIETILIMIQMSQF